MSTNRGIALSVGILFIIGTVAGVLSVGLTQPAYNEGEYLAEVAANENRMILGALMIMTMGISLALIPVVIWPVLKQYNESMAVGYVVFRSTLEPIMYIGSTVGFLLLVTVSREAAPDAELLGNTLRDAAEWFGRLTTLVWIPGALILYYVLWQTRLVPRWLSGWGFLGAVPSVAAAFLGLFGELSMEDSLDTLLHMPLAVQEMVLAVWLIVKGFNSPAKGTQNGKTNYCH